MGIINTKFFKNKDAFIYKDPKNKIKLLIYIKSNNKIIRDDHSLSYNRRIDNSYLYSFFDEEFNNYVGQMKRKEIVNTIQNLGCISLLDNDYRSIYNSFKIDRFKYAQIMKSINKQLEVNI